MTLQAKQVKVPDGSDGDCTEGRSSRTALTGALDAVLPELQTPSALYNPVA